MKLKWIKLPVDIYFSPRLRLLGEGERGALYRLIYIYMLCLAGREGADGALMLTGTKPYTAEMLARIFDIDKSYIEEALSLMSELGLIKYTKGELRILDWSDLQFCDSTEVELGLNEFSENRTSQKSTERVRRFRERKRRLANETQNETQNETNETLSETQRIVSSSYKYLSLDKNRKENIQDYTKEEKEKENIVDSFGEIYLSLSDSEENNGAASPPVNKDRLTLGEMRNVNLTEAEYEDFKREYPLDYNDRIDELSLYMASSGKEYRDHLAALKSFAKRRIPPPGESLPQGFVPRYRKESEKPRYGDFDPHEAMENAIYNSPFCD